jgi:hypothetical protein
MKRRGFSCVYSYISFHNKTLSSKELHTDLKGLGAILAQIVNQVNKLEFASCVKDNHADKYVKSLFSWNIFILLVFGHLAEVKGMRHLILVFNSAAKKLYHLRMRGIVFVSNKGKLTFLTNNLKSPARGVCRTNVICELYRNPLGDRGLFQVGQAKPEDQAFLRSQQKCYRVPVMGCDDCLSFNLHVEK